jgi:hypothetical protein
LGVSDSMSRKVLSNRELTCIRTSNSDVNAIVPKKIVGLAGAISNGNDERLFAALSELYPIEFRRADPSEFGGLNALVVLDGDQTKGVTAAAQGLPCLVTGGRAGRSQVALPGELRFGGSEVLDDYLRDRVMFVGTSNPPASELQVQLGDEVVASIGGKPIWLFRSEGGAAFQIAGVSLPLMQANKLLFQHFNEETFLQLLPLMNFLSQLVRETNWRSNSLPACLVIDDPSLYRPSYGHLDFQELAEHATKHNFFVSVATIPLDAWWVHRRVAETFRSYDPRLSVLIHGNNHTARDLLLNGNGKAGLAVAAQALRRMERLQQAHQLEVLRIMEPPHGAIADGMFPHLLTLGYEATLGTTRLLVLHNPTTVWPASFGLGRSHILSGGMPVIPRIKMTPHWRNSVLIAAFLRQPIVIVLHHGDVAGGYEPLVEIANMINELEGMRWNSPLGIARSNYTELCRQDSLTIKLYSRRIRFSLPAGIKNISIHRPWAQDGCCDELIIQHSGQEIFHESGPATLGPIAIDSPGELEVYAPPTNPVDYRTVPAPRLTCWPVTRKFLIEARDRSAPWRYWVTKLFSGHSTNDAERPASGDIYPTQSEKR